MRSVTPADRSAPRLSQEPPFERRQAAGLAPAASTSRQLEVVSTASRSAREPLQVQPAACRRAGSVQQPLVVRSVRMVGVAPLHYALRRPKNAAAVASPGPHNALKAHAYLTALKTSHAQIPRMSIVLPRPHR